MNWPLVKHPSGIIVDTTPRNFHGYMVHYDSTVIGKKDLPLVLGKRGRKGGGFDWTIKLYYGGRPIKWTLSRLIGSCFLGNIEGMQMNHLNRDILDCHGNNMSITTQSENQKHWREDEKKKVLNSFQQAARMLRHNSSDCPVVVDTGKKLPKIFTCKSCFIVTNEKFKICQYCGSPQRTKS